MSSFDDKTFGQRLFTVFYWISLILTIVFSVLTASDSDYLIGLVFWWIIFVILVCIRRYKKVKANREAQSGTTTSVPVKAKTSTTITNESKINTVTNNSPIKTVTNNSSVNTVEELKQYKELLDTGVITQEEYDAKKKQLLKL